MKGLLDYVPGNSPIHRLNPLTKLVLAFGLCAACFISSNHLFILGIILLNLITAVLGRVVFRSLRILKSLVKFSLVLFFVQVCFISRGRALLSVPVLRIPITDQGILFSLLFVLRFMAATLPLSLMLSVIKTGDLSNALVRYLRIPYRYAFVLTTAIRFIPLFAQEMEGIMEAQISRGIDLDTKNIVRKFKLLLPLCVPLLVSSVRKIEGGAISAELRGFKLRTRASLSKKYPPGIPDGVSLFLCALVLTGAFML
jgi:energy-coupling factor transport system permease protein